MLLMVLGPYLFGFDFVKVTLQATITYLLFSGLFTYTLLTTDVFNAIVMGPLTGVNVIFFGVGLYIFLQDKGEKSLFSYSALSA